MLLDKKLVSLAFLLVFASFSLAWWNSSWDYRVPVNVTEQSGSDLTNFQVKIVMDTASLISDGKMNSDCSDIRIVDSDDSTELPYWIETENSSEACNTTTTAIWTKLNLTASSTKTIYVYYGNSGATSESNGSAVFDAFDDFNDGVISSDWTVVLGEAHEVDGYLIVNGSTSSPGPMTWWNARTFDSSYLAETWGVVSVQVRLIRNAQSLSTSDDFDMLFVDADVDEEKLYHWNGSSWSTYSTTGFTCASGDYVFLKTYFVGSTLYGYANNTQVSGEPTHSSGYAGLGGYSNANVKYDWFRVRKYADPEPTTSVGSEEMSPDDATITITSPSSSEYYSPESDVIANFTVTSGTNSTFEVKAYLDGSLVYSNSSYANATSVSVNLGLLSIDTHNFTVEANTTDVYSKSVSFDVVGYKVYVYREDNVTEQLSNFTISWDGKTYSTTSGVVEVSSVEHAGVGFMVANATGYESRQLNVSITENATENVSFYLLETANGEDKTLRIADPTNTSDYLANTLVTLSLNGTTLDQRYTDSDGFVTFFMNESKNYCVEYSGNSFCNEITVTVKQPLDEKDPNTKIANYSLYVGGPVSYTYTNLNADKTFTTYLFKDTTSISVENSTYISRTYYIREAEPGQNTTIQPYLLKSGEGAYNYFVAQNINSQLLDDAYLTAFRQISGEYRTVGQIRTDQTGSGQIYLDPNTVYYFIGERYPYSAVKFTIAPKGSTYYVTFGGGTTTGGIVANITLLKILPAIQTINETTNITGIAYSPSGNINEVKMWMVQAGNTVYNKTVTNVGYGTIIEVNVSDLNLTDWSWLKPLKVYLCMVDSEGNEKCTAFGGYNNGESETGLVKAGLLIQEDLSNYTNSTGAEMNVVKAGVSIFGVLLMLGIGAVTNIYVMAVAGIVLAVLGIVPIWLVMVGGFLGLLIALRRRGG